MKYNLILVCAAGVLTGCASAPPGSSPEEKVRQMSYERISLHAATNASFLQSKTEKELTDASLDAAKNQMKDPGSVQFRNVRLVSHPNGKLICGEINAKNTYGGYVGFRLFAASPLGATTLVTGGRYVEVDELANVGLRAACGY